jgi:hypothetical protein
VTRVAGAVLDAAVDIRIGSLTFQTWGTVLLDNQARRAICPVEGLGHGVGSAHGRRHGGQPLLGGALAGEGGRYKLTRAMPAPSARTRGR